MWSTWKGMGIRCTIIEENFLIIQIGDKLKTTSIKFYVGEIKFPVYENANVCPAKLFKQYINVTKSLRHSITCLFITTSKPYRPRSKDNLASWIKSVLHDAGIDMTIFTPHSTRSASTRKAATKIPIETVLKTGADIACERLQITKTNKLTILKRLQLIVT